MGIELSTLICRLAKLEEVVPLRHAVLRPGLPRDTAVFVGDHDATTKHFGAFQGARNVCCASLMLSAWEGSPAWQLRGMATSPDLAGKGVGAMLLRVIDAHVLAHPPSLMWCNARLTAAGFYEKQGWNIRSEEFMIEGVGPHFRMSRDASARRAPGEKPGSPGANR